MHAALLLFVPLLLSADDSINKYLYPSNANSIIVVDMKEVNKSGMFTEDIKRAFNEIVKSNEQIKKISEILKFDPTKDILGFTLCGIGDGRRRNGEQQDQGLFIVNAKFDYDRLNKAIADLADHGDLTVHKYNDLPIYFNHKARQAVYFALLDQNTAIASSNKKVLQDSIQGVTDLKLPTGDLFERMKSDSDTQTPAAFKMVGTFPKAAKEQIAKNPYFAKIAENMVSYDMSFNFGSPSTFNGKIAMTTAESAEQASSTFHTLVGFGKVALQMQGERNDILEMLNKLEIEPDGKDLHFDVEIPDELMRTIIGNNRRDQQKFEAAAKKRRDERLKKGDGKSKDTLPPGKIEIKTERRELKEGEKAGGVKVEFKFGNGGPDK